MQAASELPSLAAGERSLRNEPWLARRGSLRARLAADPGEIRAAQRLRHAVFHGELGARPSLGVRLLGRDFDRWDGACDHLVAYAGDDCQPIGACRLRVSRGSALRSCYSAGEFDIAPLLARHAASKFLELGRTCIARAWRNRGVAELLWSAIWSHACAQGVDVMIGCASFPGADPSLHGEALALLARMAAPRECEVRALPGKGVAIASLWPGPVDERRALGVLPPLIRAYLRLGAMFSADAVADREFGTTDVLVVLPVAGISPRWRARFSAR
jgi:putative hemolysin